MATKAYPAVFHRNYDANDSYTIIFPDLPGCITEGHGLDDAMYMAREGLQCWLEVEAEFGHSIDPPSDLADVKCGKDEFVTLVGADVKDEVRRTLKIPRRLNYQAKERNIDLSLLLRTALERELAKVS